MASILSLLRGEDTSVYPEPVTSYCDLSVSDKDRWYKRNRKSAMRNEISKVANIAQTTNKHWSAFFFEWFESLTNLRIFVRKESRLNSNIQPIPFLGLFLPSPGNDVDIDIQ